MLGKVASAFLGAVIAAVALGAGMLVANQAGIFWGLFVTALVTILGLLAFAVPIFGATR